MCQSVLHLPCARGFIFYPLERPPVMCSDTCCLSMLRSAGGRSRRLLPTLWRSGLAAAASLTS